MSNNVSTLHPRKPLVGPRGHWLWGCAPEIRRNALDFYQRAWRSYGDYVHFRVFPGGPCYLLSHPDAVEHVLQKSQANYRRTRPFTETTSLLLGYGAATSAGELWRRQRRAQQPAFARPNLARRSPLIVEAAEGFVWERAAEPGQPIAIRREMTKLSLRIAGMVLVSTDLGREFDTIDQAFRAGAAYVNPRANLPPSIPQWLLAGTSQYRTCVRANKLLVQRVGELIEARRRSQDKPDDLLTMVLAGEGEKTDAGKIDQRPTDSVLTMLFAGHETMRSALTCALCLLGSHPQVQRDFCDQVQGKLQGRSPTIEDLRHFPLATAVFEEALRLFPPVFSQAREAIAADGIQGFPVKAKGHVILCAWNTHRHPDFWDESHAFKPQRFLSPEAKRHNFAYYPFGGGARSCMGGNYAMMVGPLVLATIVQRLRLEAAFDEAVRPNSTAVVQPLDDARVSFWPR